MQADRVVYGRSFRVTPLWLWGLQRASGLLLGPLVAVHMLMPGMARQGWLNALLLVVVLAHGYSGVRRLVTAGSTARLYAALAFVWCLAVGALGTLVVLAGF